MKTEKLPDGYMEFLRAVEAEIVSQHCNGYTLISFWDADDPMYIGKVMNGCANIIWDKFGGMYPYLKELNKKTRKKILKLISRKCVTLIFDKGLLITDGE